MAASKREEDVNGWIEIRDNPLTKVGVFPYSGAQISSDLIPDKIYMVYRPAEELEDEECIESFKLIPWTDEHAMLGSSENGLLPAEQKGIHGVIGEEVYFDGEYLRGNVKVFSEHLTDKIESGKKELSAGYRCVYDLVQGTYNGIKYDAIQRKLRANHLALVHEGRSGADVSVQDTMRFTMDTKELIAMSKKKYAKDEGLEISSPEAEAEEKNEMEKLADRLAKLEEMCSKLMGNAADEDEDEDEKKEPEEDEMIDRPNVVEASMKDEDEVKKELKEVSDSLAQLKATGFKSVLREIARRDALAAQLSNHIGTFDHACKTLDEVVKYGVTKLGLKASPGQEQAMLDGWLAGKQSVTYIAQGMDSGRPVVKASSQVTAYLNNRSN